jgi:hypothetical protein
VDVGEKDLPEGGRFLAKPYRSEQLADRLRDLIGGSQLRCRHCLLHPWARAVAIRR